ncbi:hypothetical protein TWF694_010263 [Orbilia ellipsospora]|uniref:WSC domain-containing protein n=1 Tax=Orbilia ellipsospora TaxID=2528407 RepID=A0AAV9X9C5_9PEZI
MMQINIFALTAVVFASNSLAAPSAQLSFPLAKRTPGDGSTYGTWSACTQKVTAYNSYGCYTNNGPSPTQGGILEYYVPNNMLPASMLTKQKCYVFCKQLGTRYAAFLNGKDCWCGSSLNGKKTDSSACSVSCSGDGSSNCGGSTAFSVYQDPTLPATFDATKEATNYQYQGCFFDDPERIIRFAYPVLDNLNNAGTNTMTIESCLAGCAAKGYALAGLEYARTCWCGGNLRPGAAKASTMSCNMLCTGDKTEGCGGTWAIDVYYNPNLDSSSPCRPTISS